MRLMDSSTTSSEMRLSLHDLDLVIRVRGEIELSLLSSLRFCVVGF